MEYNSKLRMAAARNIRGEIGSYAKILGEKYFNRFFEHLETVDMDNITERQFLVFDGNRFLTVTGQKKVMEGFFQPVTYNISQPEPVIVQYH